MQSQWHRLVKLTDTGLCGGFQGSGRRAGVVYKMEKVYKMTNVQDLGCGDGCMGQRYAELAREKGAKDGTF